MRDVAALRTRAVQASLVSIRRISNGLDTIAFLSLSLPALSRLREPPSMPPSLLWALDHDPSNIFLVTDVPVPTAPPPNRCACQFILNGSRGLNLAWSKVSTSIFPPPGRDSFYTGDLGVSCSCSMTPIFMDMNAVRWGG
jgi:hypothetical protein